MKTFCAVIVLFLLASRIATASESHTVSFTNACGYGTPTLVIGGNVLSPPGLSYIANGPVNGLAYLQTGACGRNGSGCTVVDFSLNNDSEESTALISLIPPNKFSVATGFGFYGGCDGVGRDCTSESCCPGEAYCSPTDYELPPVCATPNVNLAILFCD